MDEDDLPLSKFQPGDNVRVILGPFAQLTAVVESAWDPTQILILIDIFGRATPVQVDEKQIVKVV